MLSDGDRSKAADLLMQAEETRTPVIQLSKTWPDIGFEDAYAIQAEVTARKVAAGARVIGHKVGLTSKPMQEIAGKRYPFSDRQQVRALLERAG